MLDGWYCRSMASAAAVQEENEHVQEESKFKKEYKLLKRKLQNLIYENESFKVALRTAQKRLLSVTRDRSFLLDRLLLHEKVNNSTSDTGESDSSEEIEITKLETTKRRKVDSGRSASYLNSSKSIGKKKRPPVSKTPKQPKQHHHHHHQQQHHHQHHHQQHHHQHHHQQPMQLHMPSSSNLSSMLSDGHMTPEEVERHLQSQNYMELVPERAPPTVPTEMFSNEPSLDSESNDLGELETSPSNMGEELSIDMVPE